MIDASDSSKECSHDRLDGYNVKRRIGRGNSKSSDGI